MALTLKRGDTRPPIDIPLTERATPDSLLTLVPLTDVATALVILSGQGTSTVIEREGAIVSVDPDTLGLDAGDFEDGELGLTVDVIRCTFLNGDTDTADEYRLEVELTYDDGGVETVPNDDYETVTILEDLGGA